MNAQTQIVADPLAINLSDIMRQEGIERIALGLNDLFTVVFRNGKIGTGKSIHECKGKAK